MKKRFSFVDTVRPFAVSLVLLFIVTALLTFKLNTLLPGASPAEMDTLHTAQSADFTPANILKNSAFFAYQVGLYSLKKVNLLNMTSIRGLGVICGLLGSAAFFLLLRKWHTRRIALMGGLLFVTSSWFLQASRVGRPDVMYLLLPVLIYLGMKLEEGTQKLAVAVASVIILTQLLYVPGLVWMIAAGFIWQRRRILALIKEIHAGALVFLGIMTAILLVPLGISLTTNPDFWQVWLAYPLQAQTLGQFARNFLTTPWHLFFRHVLLPEFHVGRLPLLDIASSIFVALGLYWYFFQRKLDRAKLIVAGLVFGGLLTASLGYQAQSVLLPFIYILVAGGITLMLQQWFTVFPRNPLARGVGLTIVIIIVGLTSFYHLRRYFVAWPNSPEVKQIYSLQSGTIEE